MNLTLATVDKNLGLMPLDAVRNFSYWPDVYIGGGDIEPNFPLSAYDPPPLPGRYVSPPNPLDPSLNQDSTIPTPPTQTTPPATQTNPTSATPPVLMSSSQNLLIGGLVIVAAILLLKGDK